MRSHRTEDIGVEELVLLAEDGDGERAVRGPVKLGIDPLQSAEIQAGRELARNELAHELLHHKRMGKQPVIR